ncbi:glycoside hydrolase family 43 protein [Mucilaginibacter sp.]|uniref:glycoside hydrolase family 43 protein n=1 Tax=Mucilaginibacter sp. TaxID=1882438 RepID=UPI003AFFA5E8
MKNLFLIIFSLGIFPFMDFANAEQANAGHYHETKMATDTIYLADPTIFLDKGIYYLYGTGSNQGFPVYQSSDLKNWTEPSGKTNGLALFKGDAYGNGGFWAPQVFKNGRTYYMVYTADEHIAIAESDSPLGPFKQKEIKVLSGVGKQIDPFVFRDEDGKSYLYYVRLSEGNRIFVARMKDDFSDILPETAKECITATQDWENTAKSPWPVTEGPTVFKKGNLYYLFYSANDFRNPDYAVGYATARSPFGPWKKSDQNPIISKNLLKINGTGHGDFFKDKKGNMEYVFHTHHSNVQVSPRATGLIRVKFVKNALGSYDVVADASSFRFLMRKK